MPDPQDEQPWPDVLEQQAVATHQPEPEDDPEAEELPSALTGTEADPADVLDQHRSVPLPDDDERVE